MINLGGLKLNNRFLLAPMSMYSDIGFRKLCESYGCAYSFTEQILAKEFIEKSERLKRKLDLFSPCGIQFLSNSKEEMKKAILMIKDNDFYPNLYNIRSIDLNLGCPTKEIRGQNLGSELLKQASLVKEIFEVMKKYSHVPVSAKIRLGVNSRHKKSKPYLRIAKAAKEAGLDFITIHARTSAEMYEGDIDSEAIKETKEEIDIPIVGNGNISDVKSAKDMLKICDAIMIGRHALKEPFIFGELEGKQYDQKKEKLKCVTRYLRYSEEYNIGFQHIKIHVQSLLKDTVYSEYIPKITKTRDKRDIIRIIKNMGR